VIENRPAIDVIRQHDSKETLHYVDPPYPKSTRTDSGHDYNFEMTDEDHIELAKVLNSVEGMVVLSGYACDLYDKQLYPNWRRVQKKAFADGALERVEVLWINFPAEQGSLL
jgi:DNA adenine methylase